MLTENVKPRGEVDAIIEYDNGTIEVVHFSNALLDKGREALAASLANDIGDEFNFFINRMVFGDGGTNAGVPKFVQAGRNGLFGVARVNKPVIASIDSNNTTSVIFTSVVSSSEGNGYTLNEMALQMNSGDFYSMATFAGISKTSAMSITFNWTLSFV